MLPAAMKLPTAQNNPFIYLVTDAKLIVSHLFLFVPQLVFFFFLAFSVGTDGQGVCLCSDNQDDGEWTTRDIS